MFIRIFNTLLILFIVFMGIKQGWAMVSGKPEMAQLLGRFQFSRNVMLIIGLVTLLSAVLILFPGTFVAGNFLMAASILLIICCELSLKDLKGAAIELPFLLMNLVAIFLQHPLAKAD
ncbi:hypothetical protein SAMN05428949_4801 [Chitinophaga sp. YR627]|uniref:hypothetical protein n=1 Tax=Chitinophaga sp. YR627 TaxID=1881041 RepID=UPI0008EDB045|nr:hypothetical protein [Chitinophaga sp. YR627]SFO28918.1 hypothetical protein SAMN05428949_4801 [Chitinophaga sp. YR627]